MRPNPEVNLIAHFQQMPKSRSKWRLVDQVPRHNRENPRIILHFQPHNIPKMAAQKRPQIRQSECVRLPLSGNSSFKFL